MATATTAWPRQRPDIVTLEMAGAMEFWAVNGDGSLAIVLREPMRCWLCGTMHFWYVNRNGRTRCVDRDTRQVDAPKFEEVRA